VAQQIPRLELEQLDPRLRQALAGRVQRLGYLGEFFKCAALQPDTLLAFLEFTEALKDALPERLTEVVALTVATLAGNAYERNQHEQLCTKRGYERGFIAFLTGRSGGAKSSLAPAEEAVHRLAVAALDRDGRGVTAELSAVVEAIGPAQAMAVLLLIGRYRTHALVVNALELLPPVPSVFAETGAAP
jgi:hypothetical protein